MLVTMSALLVIAVLLITIRSIEDLPGPLSSELFHPVPARLLA